MIILGLGKTGLSCARYLSRVGVPFAVADTREKPPEFDSFRKEFPNVEVRLGALDVNFLSMAKTLIVSPGLSIKTPEIQQCMARGISVIGDIELFCRAAQAPIVGITGANAKGTVTTLVGEMVGAAGRRVQVGGNIGTPALDLLKDPTPEVYVLELSSFQLETTQSLRAKAATILNISPDHLDRYDSMQDYVNAKQRIYQNCEVAVFNREDPYTFPQVSVSRSQSFGLSMPAAGEWGLMQHKGETWLAHGNTMLLPLSAMKIKGKHNAANALAALALGSVLNLPMEAMLTALKTFSGLPYRCQWLGSHNNVQWYNDSKGTNVGATLAAMEGLSQDITGQWIWIAGGVGKGADFSLLRSAVQQHVRLGILLGQDARVMARALEGCTPFIFVETLNEAVELAKREAKSGEGVLLSPACASFDMFRDYAERGEIFTSLVRKAFQ